MNKLQQVKQELKESEKKFEIIKQKNRPFIMELITAREQLSQKEDEFQELARKHKPLTGRIHKLKEQLKEERLKELDIHPGDFIVFYDDISNNYYPNFGDKERWVEVAQVSSVENYCVYVGNGKITGSIHVDDIIRKATRQEMIDRIDGKDVKE